MKKRTNKSKEQLLWEMEQKKHREKLQPFIDDKLMPFMFANTENLEDAQMLTESLKVVIERAYQSKKKTMPLSELGIIEQLGNVKKPEAVKKHVGLLEVLAEQPVQDAINLLDAIYEETSRVVMQQLKEKKLSDFTDVKAK